MDGETDDARPAGDVFDDIADTQVCHRTECDSEDGEGLGDGAASADVAPEVMPYDGQDCPSPTLEMKSSHESLVPLPIGVAVDALANGNSVAKGCQWHAGPSAVCVLAAPGLVHKVGDGVCSVTCIQADGKCGRKDLVAQKQTVVYVIGGVTKEGGKHAARISRLRVLDQEWDLEVGVVPEKRRELSVGHFGGKLFLVGGLVHGSQFDYEADPEFFPKCPEAVESLGGTEGGCRAIRAFDLETGQWSVPAELPKARWWMGTAQIGQALYLAGGQQSIESPLDPTHMYRFDMGKETLHAISGSPEGAPKLLPRLVQFGTDLLQFQGPFSWKFMVENETWKPVDLGFPCKTDQPLLAVFSLPLAESNLYMEAYDSFGTGPGGLCPAPKMGVLSTPAYFKRYFDGKWSNAQQVEHSGTFFVAARGPDAVYLLEEGSFQYTPNPPPPPPVYRIATVDGPWEKLPPMPYWRLGFAAVAVEQ